MNIRNYRKVENLNYLESHYPEIVPDFYYLFLCPECIIPQKIILLYNPL